jgi:hypothetical protein
MSRVRRILGWSLFLGFLWAVGACAFHFVRYRPRCTITGPLAAIHLSADGSRLWTLDKQNYAYLGPAQEWDTHRGAVVREMLSGVKIKLDQSSEDGHYLAVELDDGTLRVLDWHAGREICVAEIQNATPGQFSPKSHWLVPDTREEETPSFIVDVASGKVVLRLDARPMFFSGDDRLLFAPEFAWDLLINKKVPDIQVGESYCPRSADGRWLLIRQLTALRRIDSKRAGGKDGFVEQARGVDLWDLSTFKHHLHRDLARTGPLHTGFSPTGASWRCGWSRKKRNLTWKCSTRPRASCSGRFP